MDEFHRDLLFLLHDVARLLRVDADKRARQHGMTRAQWAILIWLERQPGLSQKELSEILEVEPITVARLIDRLDTRGMVERRPDPRDRRIWRLHLLPPASEVLGEIDVLVVSGNFVWEPVVSAGCAERPFAAGAPQGFVTPVREFVAAGFPSPRHAELNESFAGISRGTQLIFKLLDHGCRGFRFWQAKVG